MKQDHVKIKIQMPMLGDLGKEVKVARQKVIRHLPIGVVLQLVVFMFGTIEEN